MTLRKTKFKYFVVRKKKTISDLNFTQEKKEEKKIYKKTNGGDNILIICTEYHLKVKSILERQTNKKKPI